MRKTTKCIQKMCVAAGILVLSACASATFSPDAQIMIDRALNSPTLTVRFSGARVALVELRLNGESLGTRAVSTAKSSGETNFNIDLNSLKDGDNDVEVRLFDRTGKLVGSDKTNISTEGTNAGPVFLKSPKMGATIMGPVEINVGFGHDMKDTFVSFFIDDNFKSMTNFPPFTYLWDTARESNGWHEVQAMVVDDASNSFKTRKIRVFVNNPGGRTERKGATTIELAPARNPLHTEVTGTVSNVRTTATKAGSVATGSKITSVAPGISAVAITNRVNGMHVGTMSETKPAPTAVLAVTSVRNLTPTGIRVAGTRGVPTLPVPTLATAKTKSVVAKAAPKAAATDSVIVVKTVRTTKVAQANVKAALPTAQALGNVTSAATLLPITKGQRIPNLASFAVILNDQFVKFDVMPRVDNGVPMTPFRHLIEKAGGKVGWENMSKSVNADADGKHIFLQIGDSNAKIDDLSIALEVAPYIDRGRTIVPLSFIRDALNVDVEYDKATGHVLITSLKK